MIDDFERQIALLKQERIQYHNTQSIPDNFRQKIFDVIYEYLSQNSNPRHTQSDILREIGLSPDIFTKHWNMYSPDMKVRQSRFECVGLPFRYSEVESDERNIELIHKIVSSSKKPTDTFIDTFGHLGVIPIACAKGYKKRLLWTNDDAIKLFHKALSCPVKVFKLIVQHQKAVAMILDGTKHIGRNSNADVDNELRKYFDLVSTRVYTGKQKETVNIYDFAADFFFVCCMSAEYWINRNSYIVNRSSSEDDKIAKMYLVPKLLKEDDVPVSFTNTIWGIINRANSFIAISKQAFMAYAKQFQKIQLSVDNIDGAFSKRNAPMLYIDPPKFISEFERYNFNTKKYMTLLSKLCDYEGEWIWVWKNTIDKKMKNDANYAETRYKNERRAILEEQKNIIDKKMKNDVNYAETRYKIESQAINEKLDSIDKSFSDANVVLNLFRDISAKQELSVVYYRDIHRNEQNSIVFITNISVIRGTTTEGHYKTVVASFDEFYKSNKKKGKV